MISNQVPVSEVQHRNNTKYNMYRYAIQINFMLDIADSALDIADSALDICYGSGVSSNLNIKAEL